MTWTDSTNLFGPTPFVVGATVGEGVNYTSIQSAINDAAILGGATIYIRPKASPYVENLTLADSVDLVAITADARKEFNFPAAEVLISGNHTYSGSGTAACKNIYFLAGAGDVFTLTPPAGTSNLLLENCVVNSIASRAVVLSSAGGTSVLNGRMSDFLSSGSTIDTVGSAGFALDDCFLTSSGGVTILHAGTAGGSSVRNSVLQAAATGVQFTNAAASLSISYTTIVASNGVSFTAAASLESYHNTWNCSSGSGNYIAAAAAGTYQYADEVLTGTAVGIAALVVQSFRDWKPYASTTHVGVARFNPTYFSVSATTGEVSTVVGSGGLTWFDRAVSVAVAGFTGNAVTSSGVTVTLPTTPANGTECDFLALGTNVFSIQTGGADIIRIGNSTSPGGGSATSSSLGDSIRLVYMTSSTTWCAIGGVQGSWTLA